MIAMPAHRRQPFGALMVLTGFGLLAGCWRRGVRARRRAATWPDQLGGAVLLQLSGSPETIFEQVCATTVRMLRERLELTAACPGLDDAAAG